MKKLLSLLLVLSLVGNFGTCLASDEVVEEGDYIDNPGLIDIVAPLDQGSISITYGWNLIAMPVLPDKPYTVRQFIEDVERSLARPRPYVEGNNEDFIDPMPRMPIRRPPLWKVKVVAVYKNGRFERYPKEGITYNMVPGEAYFVYAKYQGPIPLPSHPYHWRPRTTIFIRGKIPDVPVSLNLNRGWNGVSLLKPRELMVPSRMEPALLERGKGAVVDNVDNLSKELVEQGIKAKRIAFWSTENQEWMQFTLPRPVPPKKVILDEEEGEVLHIPEQREYIEEIVFLDRLIRADEGFFLLCAENGLFIPGLDMNPEEPPVPPFPVEPPVVRVRYTGIVAHVVSIPEDVPPYHLVLRVKEPLSYKAIPLKGKSEDIEEELAEVAENGDEITVEGVMHLMKYSPMLPPYTEKMVEVLLVDRVLHHSEPRATR